ncbi:MAG: arsenite efflux transporter metallochaperone ArsD [Thermodesulfobacteriota bacterium]|jgi:AhpD family alkylhydroperoxidase
MPATLQVFDPPLCCSTGVCGPGVDPGLARFAADLKRLQEQGVRVERFNLAQDPGAFARSYAVSKALAEEGQACLPLVLVDGKIVSRCSYPTCEQLDRLILGSSGEEPGLYSGAVEELVAIGAAIASNCEPCFKHHCGQALKLGVSREDMARAVRTAQMCWARHWVPRPAQFPALRASRRSTSIPRPPPWRRTCAGPGSSPMLGWSTRV